jgi:hypothetical protein
MMNQDGIIVQKDFFANRATFVCAIIAVGGGSSADEPSGYQYDRYDFP